jgi:hypothetical protein
VLFVPDDAEPIRVRRACSAFDVTASFLGAMFQLFSL